MEVVNPILQEIVVVLLVSIVANQVAKKVARTKIHLHHLKNLFDIF
jgi:hypothetical protein